MTTPRYDVYIRDRDGYSFDRRCISLVKAKERADELTDRYHTAVVFQGEKLVYRGRKR